MVALIGFAVALNIIVVLWKYNNRPIKECAVDAVLLITVAFLFKGSTDLLVIGTIGSAVVSIYLLFCPPARRKI